jgi:phospholipid N-methyltransferase
MSWGTGARTDGVRVLNLRGFNDSSKTGEQFGEQFDAFEQILPLLNCMNIDQQTALLKALQKLVPNAGETNR